MAELAIRTTNIPGLLVADLPVHHDDRGWFKENWQREKMVALGLPDFGPVQNNMSFNVRRGATRGIHTEPWDKFVSVATGRVFAAWVDMRAGESFGKTFSIEMGPETAVFVPRGVGNSYQALADDTLYSYLVNEHWRPGINYPALHLGDETAAIDWPIALDSDEVEISEKDLHNPRLGEVAAVPPRKKLITGCRGQLGRALAPLFPDADRVDLDELDLTDPVALAAWPWNDYDTILNAAAYTAVDQAEESDGRPIAWAANASAPAHLARIADQHGLTLVHYSTDYVFDGTARDGGHREEDPIAPLGVYGQTKAAGDIAVSSAAKHYILRTSWVIGEGNNFVRTMQRLAANDVSPAVVDDQVGRLTFTSELARATHHLLESEAPAGIYNVTNAGPIVSWADVAKRVYELSGRDADDVTRTTTAEYNAGKTIAPRPLFSALSLDKLASTGFASQDADEALAAYVTANPPT